MVFKPSEVLKKSGAYKNHHDSIWFMFLFEYGFISYSELHRFRVANMCKTFGINVQPTGGAFARTVRVAR